jgi:hypothetical protein
MICATQSIVPANCLEVHVQLLRLPICGCVVSVGGGNRRSCTWSTRQLVGATGEVAYLTDKGLLNGEKLHIHEGKEKLPKEGGTVAHLISRGGWEGMLALKPHIHGVQRKVAHRLLVSWPGQHPKLHIHC